jgi:putative FmdB family regulatory protein
MPLYDYKCSKCQKVTEVRHGFGEHFTDPCPECGGALVRVFNPAPIVFKGSGFYINDSRGKSSMPAKDAPAKDAPVKDSPSKDESKPAKETPAKETPAKASPAKDPAA